MKILVPDTVPVDDAAISGATVVVYSTAAPVPEEHTDAEALVAWGNPADQLRDAATRLTRLRWVQDLAAGPGATLAAGFPADVAITSGRSLHDATVAEHTLALVLAAARHLHRAVRAQIGHRWAGEIGGLQPLDNSQGLTTLRDAKVVIWGFGSIGKTVAPLLTSLGAQVVGVARSARTVNGVEVVDDVDAVLPTADILIMILPTAPSTDKALDARRLALLPPAAWLVNVGRGSTVDEDALVEAVRAGRLAGAALDVTAVEPLPADSPLWDEPQIIITPHAAGGRPLGAAALIERNLDALAAGQPLTNLVER
ncbi:NAD(P)-dependent oxidoreductase [Pseudonocardia lacus]|uniref:NAD(P)-dependent oxidoreductase n=1 Tax=Pseudonocardia lacus TaxID=2835865 RepID=UPI001BDC59F6|nr:NAD(P)-dependent oxidoreductase [Pseudonocardia lacus]